jgi:phosphate transport system permease protein
MSTMPNQTELDHSASVRQIESRHSIGKLFEFACWASTWVSLIVLLVLLTSVGYQAAGWLSWRFVTSLDGVKVQEAGLLAGLVGSFWLVCITALLSVPLGVGAAIYLEEYAKPTLFTRFIRLNIANLAGVPSIVYGILGFTLFVRMFGLPKATYAVSLGFTSFSLQLPLGRSIIAGAMTLTLLSLPVVIIAAQEALRSIPASVRHASYALGASKWQTIWFQVLPAAIPGILTGVILAMSRAIGESAPIAVLGAATYIGYVPGKFKGLSEVITQPQKLVAAPFDQFTAVPLQIYNWVNEPKQEYQYVAAAGIVVLLAVLLLLNGSAIFIRQHFQKKIRW